MKSLDIRSRELVILSGVRTPFGTLNGTLKKHSATDLALHTAGPAMARAGVSPEDIDHVIYGNVLQTDNDAIYLARHVGLKAGIPMEVPAYVVNRLCGSGFQSIVNGAQEILTGQADCVLVGGTESMTRAPHVVHGLRDGQRFGKAPDMQDLLWEALVDKHTGMPMAMTAEKLGDQHGIAREDVDAYSAASQDRWAAANARGFFRDEIVPMEIRTRKGTVTFDTDEHPRPSTPESLAKLPPVFKEDGLVTAGTASGICDGAASLVLADATWAEKKGLEPIARLVGWGVSGCDPTIMGYGPVPASKRALAQTGLSLDDMALVEVNEAFAAQVLAVAKAMGLDPSTLNVNGGSISLGHPLGASGARITATTIHALRERGEKYGLASACIGGGQGIAVIVEAY